MVSSLFVPPFASRNTFTVNPAFLCQSWLRLGPSWSRWILSAFGRPVPSFGMLRHSKPSGLVHVGGRPSSHWLSSVALLGLAYSSAFMLVPLLEGGHRTFSLVALGKVTLRFRRRHLEADRSQSYAAGIWVCAAAATTTEQAEMGVRRQAPLVSLCCTVVKSAYRMYKVHSYSRLHIDKENLVGNDWCRVEVFTTEGRTWLIWRSRGWGRWTSIHASSPRNEEEKAAGGYPCTAFHLAIDSIDAITSWLSCWLYIFCLIFFLIPCKLSN